MNLLSEFAIKKEKVEYTECESICFIPPKVSLDDTISSKQVALFEKCLGELEKIVDESAIVSDISYMNEIKLENYEFVYDKEYIGIVDRCIKDSNKKPYKYATISLGNKKLKEDSNTQFVIWNILQRITCPGATKWCENHCYANKSNTCFTRKDSRSRNARLKNTAFTMIKNFDEIILELLKFLKFKTNKHIVFRFHESGDVYSKLYLDKIKKIMISSQEVRYMWYSKSNVVLNDINQLNRFSHISLRFSIDNSTSKEVCSKLKEINCLLAAALNIEDLHEFFKNYKTIGFCSPSGTNAYHQEIIKAIEQKKDLLKLETRKSFIYTINKDILRISKDFINKSQSCACCLKCMNKDIQTIFFARH